ncbi:MAG: hypothetical protein BBJ57_12035 [Desulfobacterales bacterium PC51MH44]|nr:MAG: hypothetical protein BBJ57_12035 [Desulfobacterales bacterium PC51MH44]
MTKHYLKALILVMISTLLFSCAAQQVQTTKTLFNPYDFKADQYEPKVNNFMVILDSSNSMNYYYQGQTKYTFAKDIVNRMNQTLPDLDVMGALRTFGYVAYYTTGPKPDLTYGVTQYTRAGLEKALKTIPNAGGNSPLASAIDAASGDLKSVQGSIALIIVSDGQDMDNAPVPAAKKMKSLYGEKLCIYTILVGDDPAGKDLLDQVSQAGQCGFSVSADSIASPSGMTDFVKKAFFAKVAKPLDSDGDGVYDNLDKCPNTPAGVKVDSKGCPLDTDGDGVYDYLDKCPGTPKGAKVNAQGCWILGGILFDTDKSDIKSGFYPELDAVVTVLNKNSDLKVEIQGHTDNVGKAAYNMKLSENRANAVMGYLVQKGIDSNRLSAKGLGLTQPIASNDTPEGRAQNRRVELTPIP